MKKVTSSLLSLLILAGLGISAHAQEPDKLTTTVPFAFFVNGTKLPAGAYMVRRTVQTDPLTLTIQSKDRRYTAYLVGNVEAGADTHLVFDLVDGEHYLRAVGTSSGLHPLVRSRAEEQANHMAGISAAASGQ